MDKFIENILITLKTHGLPLKRVSLPTDKMYEAAENKGFSFNEVLQRLKVDHQIESTIGPEKIVFSQAAVLDKEEMMKQAREMMASMDPEELRKIQEMFTNMSLEQKEEVLKKGKDLGIL